MATSSKLTTGTLILAAFSATSCCTRELALTLGDAARESFFREQDRVQQRFLQLEADSIKDTVNTVQGVLKSEETRAAVRTIADDISKVADRNLEVTTRRIEESLGRLDQQLSAAVANLNSELAVGLTTLNTEFTAAVSSTSLTLRDEQTRLRETSIETLDRLRASSLENFEKLTTEGRVSMREALVRAIDDTRDIIARKELLNEDLRRKIKESLQPLIDEIISESGKKAGETMQKTIDNLSAPVAAGAGALLVAALITMVLPSLFLFMSYKRSILALQTLTTAFAALEASRGRSPPEAPL